jgi:hypothetical protein
MNGICSGLGGTQTGVMKLVGDSISKYYSKDNAKLLGISSWDCTKFKQDLEVIIL